MSIEWQRQMNPRKVLHSIDGRGIINQVRIWLLLREDLNERERYELVTAAVKAFRALGKAGQAPWEAWGDGYDPPELGVTCYLKQWIEEGPNPQIPVIRPPIGERYFLRNNHGTRYPAQSKTSGKVFIIKHHMRAPPDVGLHAQQRLKFAAAVAAWQALSQPEKEIWKRHSYARAFHLPGYQTFIHFFMFGEFVPEEGPSITLPLLDELTLATEIFPSITLPLLDGLTLKAEIPSSITLPLLDGLTLKAEIPSSITLPLLDGLTLKAEMGPQVRLSFTGEGMVFSYNIF